MGIVRLLRATEFQRETLTDIHAAAKGDAPVHHQYLAVGAQIGIGQPQPHDNIAIEDIGDDAPVPERWQDAGTEYRAPTASMSTLTSTPRSFACSSAETKRAPILSWSKIYVARMIDRFASPIASSMAA